MVLMGSFECALLVCKILKKNYACSGIQLISPLKRLRLADVKIGGGELNV